MSPALIAILLPLLQGILAVFGGPAQTWLIDHVITFVAGHIARVVRLDPNHWALAIAVENAATGVITVDLMRDGRSSVTVVLEPLALTAAHQATIAALAGALFHEAEVKLLNAFRTKGSADQHVAIASGLPAPAVATT